MKFSQVFFALVAFTAVPMALAEKCSEIGGSCRLSCGKNQDKYLASCGGIGLKCCKDKPKNPKPFVIRRDELEAMEDLEARADPKKCSDIGGSCSLSCGKNEDKFNLSCHGLGLKCCKAKPKNPKPFVIRRDDLEARADAPKKCSDIGGSCSLKCGKNEDKYNLSCHGLGLKCCKAKPQNSKPFVIRDYVVSRDYQEDSE